MWNTLILGAGNAGLTAAHDCVAAGHAVLVLDHYQHAGGNHISRNINGYTYDIGSFIFFPNYPIFQMFPDILELCVDLSRTQQRLTPTGSVRKYPFDERELLEGSPFWIAHACAALAANRLSWSKPANLEEMGRRVLGRPYFEALGLKNYLDRFYGFSANMVDAEFADQRMQFVIQAARPRAMASRVAKNLRDRFAGRQVTKQPAWVKVRPFSGFETMYAPAVRQLEASGALFRFGENLKEIRRDGEGFLVATDHGTYRCHTLVNTIPLPMLWLVLGETSPVGLRLSRLETLFLSFDGRRGFDGTILFNFHREGSWKRLTMHSDAYGRRNEREYGSIEIPRLEGTSHPPESAFAAVAGHLQGNGLFDGDLRLEGAAVTENIYPVYSTGFRQELDRVTARMAEFGIVSVGRQGLFEYLPTSAKVTARVRCEMHKRKVLVL